METSQMKIVYAITERGDRSYWTRVGVAYTNRDGSLNLRLDAFPVNGTLQVRDWTPKEEGVSENRRQPRGRAKRAAETVSANA